MSHQANLEQVIAFFETINAGQIAQLPELYSDQVFFKDPFNEVHRCAEVIQIFTHMFVQVDTPRFVVTTSVLQGDQAFLTWDFFFTMKRFSKARQCIRGASHLRFAPDGRVNFHRDYWDAAEELYEKLPLVGALMRGLKKMART